MNEQKSMNARSGETVAAVLTAVLAVVAFSFVTAILAYDTGHTDGVMAHADGKYAVTELPDGTRVVTKSKKN